MQPHNLCLLAESRSAGPGLVQQRTARGAAVGGYAGSTAQSLSDAGSVRKTCESGGSGVCAGGECGGGLQNQSAVDKMIAQMCSAVPFTVIHTRTTA